MIKPKQGGSYVCQPDGSLKRAEATAPASAGSDRRPATDPSTTQPAADAQPAPAKPSGKARAVKEN